MGREGLERNQVWLYLAAIALGLLAGSLSAGTGAAAEMALWPVLGGLLFVTFTQVPLLHVRQALADRRFAAANLVGQFLIIPALVLALLPLLPDDPVVRLGVLLVLVVPCTDWFITFTALGGGDAARAIGVSPLNLLLQLVLLPVYLAIAGGFPVSGLEPAEALGAAAVLLVPLLLAALLERWVEARPGRDPVRERLAWFPVPMLALVVGMIAAAQVDGVRGAAPVLPVVVPVFVGFLVVSLGLALGVSRLLRLPVRSARTLAFGYGTRNSFMVLPIALALPAGWELVAVVVVVQSLVELLGMIAYLRVVPRLIRP